MELASKSIKFKYSIAVKIMIHDSSPPKYIVHKFGGTSLADETCFAAIKAILNHPNEIIVVSAIKDVTHLLGETLSLAKAQGAYDKTLATIQLIHHDLITKLWPKTPQTQLIQTLTQDWKNIENILQAIKLVKGYSIQARDVILSYGEQWSAKILMAYLSEDCQVAYLDACKVIFIKRKHGNVYVDWDKSQQAWNEQLSQLTSSERIIVPGYIASTISGGQTTLGPNGSDFSSAIFAQLVNATQLTIWKNIDGIFSADPRKVRSAFVIENLSYEEAFELAYFGASVIHPDAIAPAMENNIPIYIKNTFKPERAGTCISSKQGTPKYRIQGLTSIDQIALLNIEGTGMIGLPGIAARIFDVLQQAGISVMLISQASSEHSICIAVGQQQADAAQKALNEYFHFEISRQQIKSIYAEKNCAILAAVGDGMVGNPGILGRLCHALALANINIRSIAQGSSERNISVVIAKEDIGKALRTVHAAFYLSKKTLSIGLIGPGVVGSVLLAQIHKTYCQLIDKHHVQLCVRGIISTQKMLLEHEPIQLDKWQEQLTRSQLKPNLDQFANHILADDMPHAVIIDCTASQEIADRYLDLIKKGVHIITPNKRANSGDLSYYRQLQQQAQEKNRFYFYETTVCAGLPVIKTLQDLIQTGDEIHTIEGILSGTLSYIFNELSKGKVFSSIIKNAKKLGYTEPDPRDDLSGMDVARKVVCLGRESGLDISLPQVTLENLVPEPLRSCSLEIFLERLSEFDQQIAAKLAKIRGKHQKLGYVGQIKSDGTIKVGIQAFSDPHPFAKLSGTDNMIIFHTQRYLKQALVIQGPGAGAEVTAAGVFADLLRLSSSLSR